MTTQLVVILLGICSSITLLLSALSVHRLRLLSFGVLTGTLVSIQYALTGSWSGLFSVAIGLVWTILTVLAFKFPSLNHPLFIPVFILLQMIAFVLTFSGSFAPVAFLPLICGMAGVIGIYLKKVIQIKAVLIACGIGWLVYEGHSGVYGQMVGESLNLVANTVAFFALLAAARKGITNANMENLDEQFISTITQVIHIIRSEHETRAEGRRFPQHSLNGTKVPVRGMHPNSVGYARLIEEYNISLREAKRETMEKIVAATKS
jgi:hypothetical protein